MLLRAGYFAVALKLQEAATAMCHEDIRTRLSDCLNDAFRGTGNWCYVVAVFGDDKSGDVIYSCSSDLKKASYTMNAGGAKIETAAAVDVLPLTTYETEQIEATEAGARNSKRDMIQLQTIHDSAAALGANCSMKEAHVSHETKSLALVESAATLDTIRLTEARADYEIKLIAPGKGSSAFYPAEVLKRDGPNVFKAGTHVYLNHPTAAEEAARPEGDVKNLAGVLSTTAEYFESHAKGPGLYARMKVFQDHAQTVEDKAPHVGMSIRASGVAEAGKVRDGVPVLKELTGAESVDVVTHAGAGGMILTESAAQPPIQTQEAAMDAAEQLTMKESLKALEANNKRLLERAIRGDAREEAQRILHDVSLTEVSKARVIDTVMGRSIPVKDDVLDVTAFTEAVNAEAKREGQYVAQLMGSGRVVGMGAGGTVETDPAKLREAQDRQKKDRDLFLEEAADVFGDLLGSKEAGKAAASKGAN